MKKAGVSIASLALIIIILPISAALVTFHNDSLPRSYTGGSTISGEITISLRNEPADAVFRSNFPGNITLIDLLRENDLEEGVDYTCSSSGCNPTYRHRSGDATNMEISTGDKAVGFVIERENDVEIKKIDFTIDSQASLSCRRQIEIEILGKNDSTIYNTQYVADSSACNTKYMGCFDSSLSSSRYRNATLSSEPYCNNITLEPAPAYEFGGNIYASSNNSGIIMELFDSSAAYMDSCIPRVVPGTNEVKCIINQTVSRKGDYFICISTESENSDYKIKFENEGAVCGGVGAGELTQRDYDLFAKPLPYAPLRNLSISQALQDSYGMDLAAEADMYLEERYGRNCSSACYIPFNIKGGISQQVSISNITIEYAAGGTTITEASFSLLEKSPTLITSIDRLRIKVDPANFKIPITSNIRRLELKLGTTNFPPMNIVVVPGFDFDINPKFALLGIDTLFTATTSQNITSSLWKFGEGTEKTGSGKTMTHRYISSGNYTVEVALTSRSGVTVNKKFEVLAGNPSDSARRLINNSNYQVANLTRQVNSLDPALKKVVQDSLNITALEVSIDEAERRYASAVNESEYIEIIESLLRLNMPQGVTTTKTGLVPLAAGFASIDPAYVESISNKSVPADKKEELKANLLDWNANNHDAQVNFKVVSTYNKDGETTPLATQFNVVFNSRAEEQTYLIIDYPMSEIYFPDSSGVRALVSESSSGTYVDISGKNSIEFVIREEIEAENLGAYLSPQIELLGNYEEEEQIPDPEVPSKLITFWVIALIVGTFIIYIIMQEWYKRHYESHLFRNPDDLYNIIHFIYNSRSSGLRDDEIKKKLSGSGWNGEQTSYAFKKIDGKRTGMFEIPIFSIFEHRKVKEEIARREDKPVDARFIKRP